MYRKFICGWTPRWLPGMLAALCLLMVAGPAAATKLIVEYNPRTRVATLIVEEGRVRGIITAAGREIERLITTAKQVSVNSQTGIITAVVDADLTKIRNEFGDQIFKGYDNTYEEIFLELYVPTKVSGNIVPIAGRVADPTVREVVVTIDADMAETSSRIRIPVKNGTFEAQVQIPFGRPKLIFDVRNPAGKRTYREVVVTSIQ